jgi:hypothetical protein
VIKQRTGVLAREGVGEGLLVLEQVGALDLLEQRLPLLVGWLGRRAGGFGGGAAGAEQGGQHEAGQAGTGGHRGLPSGTGPL